jgi:hypothetical protein
LRKPPTLGLLVHFHLYSRMGPSWSC